MGRTFDLTAYRKHLANYGPEGILEVAERDLSEDDFKALTKDVRAALREQRRKGTHPARRKASS
jgi:hypothetical protein